MYKAIKEIGGYKIGDTVPDDKALVWLNMYSVPQVELVPVNEVKKEPVKEDEAVKVERSENETKTTETKKKRFGLNVR